jgi:phage host-nuclease inhibitor protein Gam
LKQQEQEAKSVAESHEQVVARLVREKERLQEKYEDKLVGVQRKYQTDVEALKRQIRSLQQQLLQDGK